MKINLCCGMDYREGYLNVDNSSLASNLTSIKVDQKCNVKFGLPWETNSVEEIVFRESLEHFNRHDGYFILTEIFRVLKPGGLLDLTVPPAERQLKILLMKMNDDPSYEDFEKAHEKFTYWKWHDDLMGATHRTVLGDVEKIAHYVDGVGFLDDLGDGDSHKTLFTKKALKNLIINIGFEIKSIDDNIWVKAIKPEHEKS